MKSAILLVCGGENDNITESRINIRAETDMKKRRPHSCRVLPEILMSSAKAVPMMLRTTVAR
jgi:hypothetical protein